MTTIETQTTSFKTTAVSGALSQLIANSKIKAANAKAVAKMPETVEAMLQEGKDLTTAYESWKITFEAPSDKATYNLLDQVAGYIEKIEKMPEEDQSKVKEAMRNEINERVPSSVNASTLIETLVVKFVFKGMIRQTAYNYSKALELARKAGKKSGGAVGQFIDASGGIMKLIQDSSSAGKGKPSTGISQERIAKMRELYNLQGAATNAVVEYKGDVLDCYDTEKAAKEQKKEKPNAQKLKGSLVFFVGVPTNEEFKYQLVQGNVFDQAFENSLISQMAIALQTVSDDDLVALVDGLKSEQGFEGMAQHLMDASN